jgi:DNA-binding IclR family transcriptional regulator
LAGSPPRQAVRIQSLARANGILETVAVAPKGSASLTEISQALGLNKTTVFNLAASLVALGFLERGGDPAGYRLGMRNLELGSRVRARLDISAIARPALLKICAATGETANLAVPNMSAAIILDSFEGRHSLRSTSYAGAPSPYHSSACGKAILAHFPAAMRKAIFKSFPPRPHTPHTLTDLAALERELDLVRRQGYATESEENEVGQACIAAPIFDGFGEVAGAISVAGPLGRIAEGRAQIIRIVVTHTKATSVALGAPLRTGKGS